ncbi:MAG: GAF domain-containing protein [Neomegalonema sp.]|nr:GAF domain-containing protein [Neomegalonema sp.]
MRAKPHSRETDRLRLLESYAILDTGEEVEFTEVTELAAAICEAPIALISFVAADRQWFKARHGFDCVQTDLDRSICAHAVEQGAFLEVPDLLDDPRTVDNPLAHGDDPMRFYAGALLVADGELPLGTLCVLDRKPRRLSDLQRQALQVLAGQVMRQLKLRRANDELEILRREADHRVKNSLQTVVSLTRMQRNAEPSSEAQAALRVVEQRIASVTALHEQMHQGGMGSAVALADFLASVSHLLDGTMPRHVSCSVSVENVTVSAGQASALVICVNEFVANAIKHAFVGRERGAITIEGRYLDRGAYQLICRDDGIGMPEDDGAASGGLGMRAIRACVAQLRGAMRQERANPGTRLQIDFPLNGEGLG